MSKETISSPGFLIGEAFEGDAAKGRGYTQKTNDNLAGDNASPLPYSDIAAVGFKQPENIKDPPLYDGVSFRKPMADQFDEEDRTSFKRR